MIKFSSVIFKLFENLLNRRVCFLHFSSSYIRVRVIFQFVVFIQLYGMFNIPLFFNIPLYMIWHILYIFFKIKEFLWWTSVMILDLRVSFNMFCMIFFQSLLFWWRQVCVKIICLTQKKIFSKHILQMLEIVLQSFYC